MGSAKILFARLASAEGMTDNSPARECRICSTQRQQSPEGTKETSRLLSHKPPITSRPALCDDQDCQPNHNQPPLRYRWNRNKSRRAGVGDLVAVFISRTWRR